jgi:hypothetical protein
MVVVVVGGAALACKDSASRADNSSMTDEVKVSAPGERGGMGLGPSKSARAEMTPAPPPMAARVAPGSAGDVADASSELAQATQSNIPNQSSMPVDAIAPMIIRTGNATIQVDSIELAVARLRVLAQQLGGYVGNTSMETGSNQVRSASVEMKIPAKRWNELLAGLRPIGKREALTESAQDVGEEFVDVNARVVNARRLEERLIALLANRTGKLSDALSVERELARVREEIERYEGRMRYLRSQAAVSTMIINVHEPLPVLGNQPGSNPIADAFRSAWRNFVGFIAGFISFLGVLVPIVLLGVLIWWLIRRLGPSFRNPPAPPRPPRTQG